MNFLTRMKRPNHRRRIHKLLLIMKLVIILLTIGILQVSASGFAQKITMNKKNVPFSLVIKEIRKQTGYDFIYKLDLLKSARPVSINVTNAELIDVLNSAFKDQPFTYSLEDKAVIVKEKELSLLDKVKESIAGFFAADSALYRGRVIDERSLPMPGASVRIKESNKMGTTSNEGNFMIYGPTKGATLIVTYVGYATREITLSSANANQPIVVAMSPGQNQLGEVSIVSTGYQDLPKERATGSFEVITKEMLQHSNDPSLVKRLEGIVTSVDFRNDLTPTNSARKVTGESPVKNITVRGKNTLEVSNNRDNTSGQVLVVIDGIASPYGIEQVNPEDVENITILKDAASASIWGSRAANGVFVIKTKKGNFDRPTTVSFNSNINVTDKMDLFYKRYMSTSDYIDAEIYKFKTAKTNLPAVTKNNPRLLVSPVAEILDAWINKKTLTEAQANQQIDALRGNDLRSDYDKYFVRKSVNQNYSLSVDGGSKELTYRLSGGYSKDINNTIKSGQDRINVAYNTSVRPAKNLELTANINYVQANEQDQSPYGRLGLDIGASPYFPYVRMADEQGNPLAVNWNYRQPFLDLLKTTYGDKILDLTRKPLEDIKDGSYSKVKSQAINININANYKISDVFSANIAYSPNWGLNEQKDLTKGSSFYMRNLINRYTDQVTLVRNIPLGDLYIPQQEKLSNQTLRGQLNANKIWKEKHELTMIAGVDIAQSYSISSAEQYFGYNEDLLTSKRDLNYKDRFTTLFVDAVNGSGSASIPYMAGSLYDSRLKTIGIFANAAYTYDRRYTLTTSIRKDQSSDFGGNTNSKGAPFYHIGGGWNLSNEHFYDLSWLPLLRLRSTYGYNGNVNPSASATPVLERTPLESVDFGSFLPFANTRTPTNSKLRPERTGVLMLGLDWGLKNNRLSGTLEYYNKQTTDLIAGSPVDPSSGFTAPPINNGNLKTEGVDLILNSLNIQKDLFRWNSSFLFSYNRVKVKKLYSAQNLNAGSLVTDLFAYSEGYDLGRLFAYKWGGLDPVTGDPRGYVDGNLATISNTTEGNQAYTSISTGDASGLRFFGSAIPVYFGAFRNTFSYGRLSVSMNILYKLGYWFRRPTSDVVAYERLYRLGQQMGIEYEQRWQKPGDELRTNVPSAIYPASVARDQFYNYSEVNVLRADHIRFQEINFSYVLKGNKGWIKNPRISANVNNLGILWRANKAGLDPDILDVPNPRTYSIGFSTNF